MVESSKLLIRWCKLTIVRLPYPRLQVKLDLRLLLLWNSRTKIVKTQIKRRIRWSRREMAEFRWKPTELILNREAPFCWQFLCFWWSSPPQPFNLWTPWSLTGQWTSTAGHNTHRRIAIRLYYSQSKHTELTTTLFRLQLSASLRRTLDIKRLTFTPRGNIPLYLRV